MLAFITQKLGDPHFLLSLLAAIGCAATVLSLAGPYLQNDVLGKRMKAVGSERDLIRMRERDRMNQGQGQSKAQLRVKTSNLAKDIVDRFSLRSWLGTDTARRQLANAGFRGGGAEYTFLAFRMIMPILLFIVASIYAYFFMKTYSTPIRVGVCILSLYMGVNAPSYFLRNRATKRQLSMERAYPNMLDLLIITTESGMSIEHSVRKVSLEIGQESVHLAEELVLLAAEMSYLPDRRVAFENLADRVGMDSVKALTTVLVQSERYGTPLGAALRVLAAESRQQRMTKAEKKAASLPPTLTVPMILFFLPALFVVILTPAAIQIFKLD
jgi:tight adherence protein C